MVFMNHNVCIIIYPPGKMLEPLQQASFTYPLNDSMGLICKPSVTWVGLNVQ
jgi:hypothetical protein